MVLRRVLLRRSSGGSVQKEQLFLCNECSTIEGNLRQRKLRVSRQGLLRLWLRAAECLAAARGRKRRRAEVLSGRKASPPLALALRLGSAEPAGRGSAPESSARRGLLRGVAGVDVFASQVCPALLCAAFLAVREERLSAPKVVAEVAVEEVQLKEAERPRVSG